MANIKGLYITVHEDVHIDSCSRWIATVCLNERIVTKLKLNQDALLDMYQCVSFNGCFRVYFKRNKVTCCIDCQYQY